MQALWVRRRVDRGGEGGAQACPCLWPAAPTYIKQHTCLS